MAIRLAIFVYYLYFAVGALHARFATDDMMNLGYYWGRGFWACIQDNILFWRTAYRPMGALFYLPIYHIFGLNPLPYRIIVLLILAANVYLTYRVAELVVHSKAAALAAMVVAPTSIWCRCITVTHRFTTYLRTFSRC